MGFEIVLYASDGLYREAAANGAPWVSKGTVNGLTLWSPDDKPIITAQNLSLNLADILPFYQDPWVGTTWTEAFHVRSIFDGDDNIYLGGTVSHYVDSGMGRDVIYGGPGDDIVASWGVSRFFGGQGTDATQVVLDFTTTSFQNEMAQGRLTLLSTGTLTTVRYKMDGWDPLLFFMSGVENVQFTTGVEVISDWKYNDGDMVVYTVQNIRPQFFIGDFNGDGKADIPLQNDEKLAVWLMSGLSLQGGNTIGALGAGWFGVSAGDFNGDGRDDLLLQNGNKIAQWQLNGASLGTNGMVATINDGWMIAGTGDFNGDRKSDVLVQNEQKLALWQMDGLTLAKDLFINTLGEGWGVAGLADFNGDGRSDILLQAGQNLAVWLMNGSQIAGGGNIATLGAGWRVVGTGDFTHDGKADILLQKDQLLALWQMDGKSLVGGGNIYTMGNGWSVASNGDFNGDGYDDVLLQNGSQFAEWLMHGTTIVGGGNVVVPMGAGWDII